MTRYSASQRTLLVADPDRRRFSLALYPVRRAARRLLADCEHLMDCLSDGARKQWVDAVGDALIGAHHLITLLTHAANSSDTAQSSIALRTAEPQRRIITALSRLLELVPVGAEEELLLQDARAIRDAAAELQLTLSNPGKPAARPESKTDRLKSAKPTTAPRARVVLADDERAIRDVVHRRLVLLGYDIIEAKDGQEALELIRREPFDLLLTDITMPRLNGIELIKALKSDDATRYLPVIVLSGQGDAEVVVECLDAGAEDHIAKPYEASILKARVRACLDRKRLRDLERDYQHRVAQLTAAAEAVEQQTYESSSLSGLSAQNDELGRLARVFDRTVSALKSREERLQHRLQHLRKELTEAGVRAAVASDETHASPYISGEILAGRYEIIETLGRGGMGTVYRARDRELREEVAIKVVRRDLLKSDPTIVARLKSEIRLTRKLSHRNVVRAHDLGEFDGTYFISMEYVKGITVAQLLDRRGRLSVESTLAIGTQLADALAVAHDAQIIHRDIKPENLLVDESGVLKVMDFGIARLTEREERITEGGFIVGTPEYMAPEQLVGGKVDGRSDLFAAGVVLYECLAGRPPFVADGPAALLRQLTANEIVPIAQIVPRVPERLDALIQQLLKFQPAQRPASARDLATSLGEIESAIQSEPGAVTDPIDLEFVESA